MAPRYKPYINRELSWLEFNQRVLNEARDPQVPLLERLRFLAITGSNFDEFFMVRVGGLRMLDKRGHRKPDPSGRTPAQQLAAVSERCHRMVQDQYTCLTDELVGQLEVADIVRLHGASLTDEHRQFLDRVFHDVIYPSITPMALDTDRAFPLLRNLTLHLAVRLAPAKGSRKPRFAVFPLEPALDRLVRVPSLESFAYLLIEDVVKLFLESLFPDERIMECQPFRITRNADMSVQEDLAPDLLKGMLDVLDARREGACVRLEIAETATQRLRNFLQSSLALRSEDIYAIPGPIDLAFLSSLADLQDHDELKYEAWPPQPSPAIDPALSMVENVAKRDILLQHPYEHFDPVVRLMDEAADDPQVMAIKQILYRTSYNSPIVTALRRAARKGKYVTVIVELKARFDEARNIEWAQAMERDGVQVIYGIKGLKTHAKLTIIVRRDPEGVRRYLHIGTGNYNEATARLYSDTSYFTCDEDLGTEASIFFNTITGFSQPRSFHFIAAAPLGLRDRILELIEAERAFKKQRQKALIVAKLNALVDPDIIQALYGASQEGVEIRLNVRGICCLRPQVPGISENITVTSIVDRYLEHSRIFYFHHGGEERLYLSSADWMPRNLDRRIELLVPVRDKRCCGKLLDILNVYLDDNVKAQRLLPDGSHERVMAVGRRKRVRSQEALYDKICQSVKKRFKQRPVSFKPHRPTADE